MPYIFYSRHMETLNQFTNKYELSKTLRFRLKPQGNTQQMLEENAVFATDHQIKLKYEATKPYIDRLHSEFLSHALGKARLEGLESYLDLYRKFVSDKKNNTKKNQLKDKEKNLREQIKKLFDGGAKQWKADYPDIKFKKSDIGILFEEAVFKLLAKKYSSEDDAYLKDNNDEYLLDESDSRISIFADWKGFTGYFDKFFETRKNYYKDDGTSTAIATRIVDHNLRRFCDNIMLYQRIKDKVDFSVVEKHYGITTGDIFSASYYSNCLLQDGIDKYNLIIGGETLEDGKKIQGLNELINQYRQKTKEKLPFFKRLDNQIAGEHEKAVFIDEIEDDAGLKDVLTEYVSKAEKRIAIFDELIVDLLKNPDDYDLNKIFINRTAFNTIAHKWCGQAHQIEEPLFQAMKAEKLSGIKYDKKEDRYSFPDFIPLNYLKDALEKASTDEQFWKPRYYKQNNEEGLLKLGENVWKQFMQIFQYEFDGLHSRSINTADGVQVQGLNISLADIKELLDDFSLSNGNRKRIKPFVDDVLHYYQLAKYFSLEKGKEWNPAKLELSDFYTHPEYGYELFNRDAYAEIIRPYNKIRNYLTKKPYSEEKWKLNFENDTLADGWDKNKEKDNSAIILQKDGRYYLGIMAKGHNDLFSYKNKENFEGAGYEKMVYKVISDASKDIQNLILIDGKTVRKIGGKGEDKWKKFCEKQGAAIDSLDYFDGDNKILEHFKNEYLPQEINDIRRRKSYLKSSHNFNLEDLHKFIEYYRRRLDYFDFDFNLKNTDEYNNFVQFTDDLASQGYNIYWQNISEGYINEKNEAGELYLFEIHNKDWNLKDGKEKIGAKNLHTLYFESLFSEESRSKGYPVKLNGEAEIFFRPKTEINKLGTTDDGKGGQVVKHKRYSKDAILFHVPITLNRQHGKTSKWSFNKEINTFLLNNPDVNIIGVDRGEKHLAYYSVIDQSGNVLESDSLNVIGGVDYHAKLTERAKDREQSRKDWQAVADIKNLKKGYISQVARKLADLAIEYNAIIVLEDLNMRFKQQRGGIEKSVYQQLEGALIDKLSFLVNKSEQDAEKAGHPYRAYQLAAPFESFKDMGKQTGIVFYTQANYTSKIDPLTGWRPNLYLKKGNAQVNKDQIMRFDNIEFANGRFEFSYNLKKFGDGKRELPAKTSWKLCSSVERWRWNRKLNSGKGDYEYYANLTDSFRELFESCGIDTQGDILGQIEELETAGNEKFFSSFIFYWQLLCQIRNTDGNFDAIISPVEPFFDSRQASSFGDNLPNNGDENGAYNIARKGIIILKDRIPAWHKENAPLEKAGEKEVWPKLFIGNADWDNFATR